MNRAMNRAGICLVATVVFSLVGLTALKAEQDNDEDWSEVDSSYKIDYFRNRVELRTLVGLDIYKGERKGGGGLRFIYGAEVNEIAHIGFGGNGVFFGEDGYLFGVGLSGQVYPHMKGAFPYVNTSLGYSYGDVNSLVAANNRNRAEWDIFLTAGAGIGVELQGQSHPKLLFGGAIRVQDIEGQAFTLLNINMSFMM
jgi:hypothetical protein